MSSLPLSTALAEVVDEHIAWLVGWHRLAFLDFAQRPQKAEALTSPPGFLRWRHSAIQSLPQDQPVIDRLGIQHEQLHTMARLVLMKAPEGQPVARKDYDAVIAKYDELMQGLRRLERAFSVAASGLDPLTGLRSRTGLLEDLNRDYNRFSRSGKPFCLAIMDIDHFKAINDTHGHDAGDRVLASVADHISQGVRSFDDVYRLGGEEFLLCLKDADISVGHSVVDRLRAGLEKKKITLADGASMQVTASFGLMVSAKDITPAEMLQRVDQALYKAKNQGRNRVETAT